MKLLINPEDKTYYALPDDLLVPPGTDILVTLQGEEVNTHLPALAQYAKSKAELKATLKVELDAAAKKFSNQLQLIRAVSAPEEQQVAVNSLFMDLIGIPEADRDDPKKVAQAQSKFQEGFYGAMAAFQPAQLDEIKLPDNLNIPDIDVDSPEFKAAAQKLGPKMDELLSDPRAQASVERLFRQITENFQNDPEKMEQFIGNMDKLHDKLYGEQEAEEKAKREEAIRASARSAIAKALQARGIRPLGDRD